MNAPKTIMRLTCVAVLLTGCCYGPVGYVQQGPAPSTEQEFLDAIRKGNSARVSELLKQNSALINARTKKGVTAVLLAVYAQHPEIAESLIATGIDPSIFEAAATVRVERVRFREANLRGVVERSTWASRPGKEVLRQKEDQRSPNREMEPTRISKAPLDTTVSALIYSVSVLTDYLYDLEKETEIGSEAAQPYG